MSRKTYLSDVLRNQQEPPAQPTPQQLESRKYIPGYVPETPQQYLNHLEWEREIDRGAQLTQWKMERTAIAVEVTTPIVAGLLETLIEQNQVIEALAEESLQLV